MRLVRCPACQTVFRLQPEQLRAHGGMVRCGHCFTLFDARENFVDTGAHPQPAQIAPASKASAPNQLPPEAPHRHAETLFVLEDADPDLTGTPTDAPPATPPAEHAAAATLDPLAPDPREWHTSTGVDPLDFGVPNDFHTRSPAGSPQSDPHGSMPEPAWPARSADSRSLLLRRRRGVAPDPLGAPTSGQPTSAEAQPRSTPPITAYWPSLDELEPDPEPAPTPAAQRARPETPTEVAEREALERSLRMRERMNSIIVQDRNDDAGRIEPRFNPHARTTAELAAEKLASPDKAAEAATTDRPDDPEDRDDLEPTPAEAAQDDDRDDDYDAQDDDSAQRYAPAEAPPASAGARWLQGLAIGMLLGLLGAQSAYLFRDDITRQWPELRPLYLQACARLGCHLPLPKDSSLIEIETSDLEIEPANPSRYTLNAVVRNRARFPQQHPHLELTLTDSRDRPVVRRVLPPHEWIANPAALASGLGPSSSQPLQLGFETSGVGNAVGYRLYAFFP